MKKRTKALIILFTPFLIGFLLGFLLAGGFRSKAALSPASLSEDSEQVSAESAEAKPAAGTTEDGSAKEAESEEFYLTSEAEEETPEEDVEGLGAAVERKEVIYYAKRMPYSTLFADLNDAHLSAAKNFGIAEVHKVPAQAERDPDLVRVQDTKYYELDKLRYSMALLTRGAADELERISKAFCDSLKSKNLLDYKLVVSSLLRTEEDVVRLRRSGNPNASVNSAHCYGTTFDISYTRYACEDESTAFMQPFELTKVLGEVLRDERNAGRILVKYERKEHCFHITACQ